MAGAGEVGGTTTATAVAAAMTDAAYCGSATIVACCASAATRGGSVVIATGCGSETSAAPREPSLTVAAAALPAARDALDERHLVGTAASDLSTLAGARGGTVGATL
jgi:hypothetical protein